MATSDLHMQTSRAHAPAGRITLAVVAGVVVGLLAYYVISIVATAPLTGWFTVHPLILLMVGVVAAASVFVSWRVPVIGLVAGVVVLAIVAFVVVERVSWNSSDIGSLTPTGVLGYGAASGYPIMLGAVMVTGSIMQLLTRRTNQK